MLKNPSPTKRGPGRRHGQGLAHASPPTPSGGAWTGQHTTSDARRVRRISIAVLGRRQYLKALKAERRRDALARAG